MLVKVAQSCPTLCDPRGLYSPWNSSGQNTGVDSLSLLQEIFPTQVLKPVLLYCRQILYQLGHQGSPQFSLKEVANDNRFFLFVCLFTFKQVTLQSNICRTPIALQNSRALRKVKATSVSSGFRILNYKDDANQLGNLGQVN